MNIQRECSHIEDVCVFKCSVDLSVYLDFMNIFFRDSFKNGITCDTVATWTASLLRLSAQLSVLLSMRYLQTAVEGAMALENPEEDSDGYLLEKGVKETFEDLKANALNMLKLVQVEPGAAEESPQANDTEKGTDGTAEKTTSPTPAS